MRFLCKIASTINSLLRLVFEINGRADIAKLSDIYNCAPDIFKNCFEQAIKNNFMSECY